MRMVQLDSPDQQIYMGFWTAISTTCYEKNNWRNSLELWLRDLSEARFIFHDHNHFCSSARWSITSLFDMLEKWCWFLDHPSSLQCFYQWEKDTPPITHIYRYLELMHGKFSFKWHAKVPHLHTFLNIKYCITLYIPTFPTNSRKTCCVHDHVFIGACVGIGSITSLYLDDTKLILLLMLKLDMLICRHTHIEMIRFVVYFIWRYITLGNRYVQNTFYRFHRSTIWNKKNERMHFCNCNNREKAFI